MEWTQVDVLTTSEAVEAIANILTEQGASGIQIDDSQDIQNYQKADETVVIDWDEIKYQQTGAKVIGYFPQDVFVTEALPVIENKIKQLAEFGLAYAPGTVKVKALADDHWATAWKKYYRPVRLTRHLTIVPAWDDYQKVQTQEQLIVLDPGMAFGTGTHPTTRLMIEALTIIVRGSETMLDVGTGSGVLSIAAKHLGVKQITATDIDQVAVDKAKENLALNPIAQDVTVKVSDLLADVEQTNVDLIVANILAEVIVPLIPQAWAKLRPGGHFLTSGIIADKLDLIIEQQTKQGFIVDQQLKIGDWCGLIAHKPAVNESNQFTAQG
ncbi:ribosomal protein L11 methyltransferase [Weissella beninensis]|uniref:Ribosomal protein L11 methyltransferase n=1 Tax=Periweissella beninensis TaxID=504936 RepID=A0ABT0VJC8_9LACO|nr:50S ribosomal protein L11 methyltransferase [Periweissella beninensis]MBM7544666.1 ribosomal protein L11 methyltransferase [Periweissella beninensis]MCM2437940.1 50S ribosomal protein L11 methyltransferase [Periweissella beninensis]